MTETEPCSYFPLAWISRDRLVAGIAVFYIAGGAFAALNFWNGDKPAEEAPYSVDLPMRDSLAPLRPSYSALTIPLSAPKPAFASAGPALPAARTPVAARPAMSAPNLHAMMGEGVQPAAATIGKGAKTADTAAAKYTPSLFSAGRIASWFQNGSAQSAVIEKGASPSAGGSSASGAGGAALAARGGLPVSPVNASRPASRPTPVNARNVFPKSPMEGQLNANQRPATGNPGMANPSTTAPSAAAETSDSTRLVTAGKGDGVNSIAGGTGNQTGGSSPQNSGNGTASGQSSSKLSSISNVGANTTTVTPSPDQILPVGATAIYKRDVSGDKQVWAATRINDSTIIFLAWSDPLASTNIVWRSQSSSGKLVLNDGSSGGTGGPEIQYAPVTFYDSGLPADIYGKSNGPYSVSLTEDALYLSYGNVTRTEHAKRIGFGHFPLSYTRIWCGLNTLCAGAPSNLPDGWPLLMAPLRGLGTNNVDYMIIAYSQDSTTGAGGFLTMQMYSIDGDQYDHGIDSCNSWTTELGLCSNGKPYKAYGRSGSSAGGVVIAATGQWWGDANNNHVFDCAEAGPKGSGPPGMYYPHGVAVAVRDRNSPTSALGTWAASTEGSCQ